MSSSDASSQEALPSPFRNRNFLLLWLAQLVSMVGDFALTIAVPILIYNATNSKTLLSYTEVALALPALLFGLVAGVFVDRWDRRRTMIVCDLGRAAAVLLLLCVRPGRQLGPMDLALFYGVTFLTGAFSCFFSPARVALMAALLPRSTLLQANAISSSSVQISQLLGPALGGVLLVSLHARGLFVFDAVTFVLSALMAAGVDAPPARPPARTRRGLAGVLQEAGDGLRYVGASRVLVAIFSLLTVALLGAGIYNALEYAFARDYWHVSPRGFGVLMSCFGLGMVLGGLAVSGPFRNARPVPMMAAGFWILAVAGFALAWSGSALFGGILLFSLGLGNVLINLPMVTLFQTSVSNEMLGRVAATSGLVLRVGAAVSGMLAAALSGIPLRILFACLAGAYLLCALLTQPLLGRPEPSGTASGVAESAKESVPPADVDQVSSPASTASRS